MDEEILLKASLKNIMAELNKTGLKYSFVFFFVPHY